MKHQPVLLKEVLENLAIQSDGIYIDATFGRGGHAQEILKHLNEQGRLMVLDKDPEAVRYARELFHHDQRVAIYQNSFADLGAITQKMGWMGNVNGILLDLGVSSPQLDDPKRGFSFLQEGPLDMRMDPTSGVSASTWINTAKEAEIAEVLKEYGEERFAKRIARAIVLERKTLPIDTTRRLADIASAANPAWEKTKHPATRTFQAVRIFINNELHVLQETLMQSLEILALGGRLAVISFHSLEDRIVKHFMRSYSQSDEWGSMKRLRRIGKAIMPSDQEIQTNPRSRSAVLRIAEKIA